MEYYSLISYALVYLAGALALVAVISAVTIAGSLLLVRAAIRYVRSWYVPIS